MEFVTFKDLSIKFTECIQEYLKDGWVFNASSMGGSQGDVCYVDLIKDTTVVRIRLQHFMYSSIKKDKINNIITDGGYCLSIGHLTDNTVSNTQTDTLYWNASFITTDSKRWCSADMMGHPTGEFFEEPLNFLHH